MSRFVPYGMMLNGQRLQRQPGIVERAGQMHAVEILIVNVDLVVVKIGGIEGLPAAAVLMPNPYKIAPGFEAATIAVVEGEGAADVWIPAGDVAGFRGKNEYCRTAVRTRVDDEIAGAVKNLSGRLAAGNRDFERILGKRAAVDVTAIDHRAIGILGPIPKSCRRSVPGRCPRR